MAITRTVISTTAPNGENVMGLETLVWRFPDDSIVSGSLLTVESNEVAIVKSRGAILGDYTMGQYALQTPDKPILGGIAAGFFGGTQPMTFEVFYVSKAKHFIRRQGRAFSSEMAEMQYEVDFYFHVPDAPSALELITHLPIAGGRIMTKELGDYSTPVVEQAINEIVQVTALENVNANIARISDLVHTRLEEFLKVYGVRLDMVKVLIYPNDPLMKRLISFRAFGMTEKEATNAMIAYELAQRGVVSAPNALIGAPFNVGSVAPVAPIGSFGIQTAATVPPPPPPAPAASE
jgi:membrane protease subunit (stomatin/prohibitin family)